VGRTDGVDQARTLAELTGLPYHAFGKFMDYRGGQYGMAALSATRLLDSVTYVLPDGEEPRSALAVRIRPRPTMPELVFVGIHFYRTEPERLAQAHFTFPADKPAREIDFVLYRPADRIELIEYRVVDERLASDHRPVLAVIVVKRER